MSVIEIHVYQNNKKLTVSFITTKEQFPIVLALEICGKILKNHKILFFSDNMAFVEINNEQSSKDTNILKFKIAENGISCFNRY